MDIAEIMESVLDLDDSFEFGCNECGNCCRNRKDAISITGVDLYYLAKATGESTSDVIKKNMSVIRGYASGLPVLQLKERDDGSCRYLRKGKCSVHANKPMVCRLYPLGRIYDPKTQQFKYFTQSHPCKGNGTSTTLREWLALFDIPSHDEECKMWGDVAMAGSMYMVKNKGKSQEFKDHFAAMFFSAFYLALNTDVPYLDNMKENTKHFAKLFPGFKI